MRHPSYILLLYAVRCRPYVGAVACGRAAAGFENGPFHRRLHAIFKSVAFASRSAVVPSPSWSLYPLRFIAPHEGMWCTCTPGSDMHTVRYQLARQGQDCFETIRPGTWNLPCRAPRTLAQTHKHTQTHTTTQRGPTKYRVRAHTVAAPPSSSEEGASPPPPASCMDAFKE